MANAVMQKLSNSSFFSVVWLNENTFVARWLAVSLTHLVAVGVAAAGLEQPSMAYQPVMAHCRHSSSHHLISVNA
jgi:hypothetical protein